MSERKEVRRYTDQEIFDCLDIHHMCRGPYVLASDYDALLSETRRLRTAIAGAREAIELALRCIDGHTPVDYCPERVRHNNAKDQLRALSSIGDLPAGEEG